MNLLEKTNLELRIMCRKAGLVQKGGKLDLIKRLNKLPKIETKKKKKAE